MPGDFFAATIDALFADPNLATDAVYRAGGADPGAPPVSVILRRPDRLGETRIVAKIWVIDVRVSEVAAPKATRSGSAAKRSSPR